MDEPRARSGVSVATAAARALLGRERRRRARLVVVLDEADEPLLVAEVGRQVPVHRLGAVVHEPVVEPLVVAVVEALLLERPLEVPVRLGHEDEAGMRALDGGDHRRPVVVRRPRRRRARPRCARRRRSSSASPCRSARRRTASAIDAERLDHGRAQVGRERVQLHDVGPGREVRVAAVREHAVADARRTTPGRARGPRRSPRDEVLRVRRRPRVVGRDVVRHEVEDQPERRARRAPRAPRRGPAGPPRCASTA